MPDPVCTTPLDRLPDRFLTEALTRMDRDIKVLALNVMTRIDVLLGRISSLFTGKVETHHSMRPEINGKFGNFLRNFRRHVSQRAQDDSVVNAKVSSPPFKPFDHS